MKPSITIKPARDNSRNRRREARRQKEQRRKTRAGRRERQRFWKKEDWLP